MFDAQALDALNIYNKKCEWFICRKTIYLYIITYVYKYIFKKKTLRACGFV